MEDKKFESRLEYYRTFLDESIMKIEKISDEESLQGAITADREKYAYISARDKLYELFPEIKSD